jgi:uncharacterized protein YifE (UPF0438 family)
MLDEVWKDAVGYEGRYLVSNFGNVRHLKSTKNRKLTEHHGQVFFNVFAGNRKVVHVNVHRLVWETFKGSIPEKVQVDHIDRDHTNNHLTNLRLATNGENGWNKLAHRDNPHGFKGITKSGNKWVARINKDGRAHCLGSFKSKEEAAMAYDLAANKLHGSFALCNFGGGLSQEQ